MTKLQRKVVSVLAAGAIVLSMATPALADTTVTITGNGSGSNNAAVVTQTSTTTVSQTNKADVNNNVTSNANTGGNDANYNTGGDVMVKTGGATTTTNVTNTLNSNAAQVSGCNCGSDTNVAISGNGAKSTNLVTPTVTNTTAVEQSNQANVENNVHSDAKTGGNDANLNTGGTVMIGTGPASSTSNVSTTANANSASVGGGAAGAGAPSASFVITGNGSGSNNYITGDLSNTTAVEQSNSAMIDNNVHSDAKTGGNDAKFNTGGSVLIGTGAASANATIDNMVNFNAANVDCGCTLDVLAKIAGNGVSGSELSGDPNVITLDLSNANATDQGNCISLDNNANSDAKTGSNDANLNTGAPMGNDPAISTGGATNSTTVNNSGNVNTVGGTPFVLPLPGGSNVSLSFDIQALLAFFGMSV